MSAPVSPRCLAEVTPAWLTSCLQAAGVDAEVAEFMPQGLGEVHGLLAELQRLHLVYAGEQPKILIIKFWAASEQNRDIGLRFGVYRREVLFYRDAAAGTGMALPKVYTAEIDVDDAFRSLDGRPRPSAHRRPGLGVLRGGRHGMYRRAGETALRLLELGFGPQVSRSPFR